MKILSWNIQGGGTQDLYIKYNDKNKPNFTNGILYNLKQNCWNKNVIPNDVDFVTKNIEEIGKILSASKADIIVLQEFQFQFKDFLFPYLKGYNIMYNQKALETKHAQNGVLIASKDEICMPKVEKWDYQWDKLNKRYIYNYEYDRRNFLPVTIGALNILGVHIPVWETGKATSDKIKQRDYFWKKVDAFAKKNSSNSIILGDFNTLKEESDIQKLINSYSTKFIQDEPVTTTQNTCIDYIFYSIDLADKISNHVDINKTSFSDHFILTLSIQI